MNIRNIPEKEEIKVVKSCSFRMGDDITRELLMKTAISISKLEPGNLYIANVHPNLESFCKDCQPRITDSMLKLTGMPGIFKCVAGGAEENRNIYDLTLNGLGAIWGADYLIDYEEVVLP